MSRNGAFTLVECLVALIIMSLITVLVSFQIRVIKSSTTNHLERPLDWYLCLAELESPNHQFTIEEVSQRKLQLASQTSGASYELRATDQLYLSRVNRGGYMLLFADIKAGSTTFCRLSGSRVEIRARRKNGQQLLGVVRFYEKKEDPGNLSGICSTD
ncbi:MAG: type II secretion system GspH family protein [Limosilactobacillus sp.]|jgi:competence protein ComGF|uniref:prepilin-type N-terminal cleavage/methylation domain-containing protein n=1 Tax=Limosilactobacillus sp. TaxID=2773925 RepID=UPI0025BAE0F7|nr:prepilin-type N-terminal cleavage/methylation domain-containing protein [Limosilactobacillus sp.]MCI1975391.1 type II secretion system GspH family protein [Limosilactobacillus sp.]MCI2031114.1 type II secretion system GspH family protein [Limosilactobacillus sp.]